MAGKRKVYEESMRMAAAFSWDKDWPNAVKAYRAALQEFAQDTEALIGLGMAYFELEQYESAIRALQRTLKLNPGNHKALQKMGQVLEKINRFAEAAKTYVYAGNLYAKAGELDQAVQCWEQAILADPNQIQARNNLAHAYSRQGNTEQAISELIALAALFQEQDKPDKAAQYLEGALRLNADHLFATAAITALKNGASVRIVQQEMAQAAKAETDNVYDDLQSEQPPAEPEEPEQVEEISSEDDGLLSFSQLASEQEDSSVASNPRQHVEQMALEELAGIIFEDEAAYANASLDKSQIDALIGQAIDWQTRGDISKAIETYQQIAQTGFNRCSVHFMLGSLFMQHNEFDQAIAAFNKAKSEKAYLQGVNFALGECYKKQNDANNALRYLVEVLRIIDLKNIHREGTEELNQLYQKLVENYVTAQDSAKTMAFVEALNVFLSSKNYEQKIIQARQRLGNGDGASVSAWIEFLEAPNTEMILVAMSDMAEYMQQNMLMTAAETCYRAIQRAPFYLPLHLRLAEIYMKQEAVENSIKKYLAVAEVYQVRGNMKQVVSIYQKVLKVAPMDVSVRSKLVELHISKNDIDAAIEQYQILADSYYQLAQIEKSLEKYQEALKLATQSASPKTRQIQILHRLGDIYTQRVDWTRAADVYRQLVSLSPADDKALLSLVDLYFKLGHKDNALEVLDTLIALYLEQQNHEKLLEILQDMTQLRPHELPLHEKLADVYVQLGINKQAIIQYDLLGEMQLEAGLRDDAARTIQYIIELGPDDPSGYKQLLAQIKGSI